MKYPGAEHLNTYQSSYAQIDTFKSPAVRFAPGLSLHYLDPLPGQTGISIDGDSVDVITSAVDSARLKFLEFLPASLAYETARKDNVLVLEPKGGLHALMAEYFGAKHIDKVESNPMIIRVVQNDFKELSGRIYSYNTWTGYGRNFLNAKRKTDDGLRPYNIIDLPMTGSAVGGTFGISEDYKYTVEAFAEYLSALAKDGVMSISMYLVPPPRTEFRILASIIQAFDRLGIADPSSHLAAIRSWDSMTILTKKSPFTDSEINHIREFSLNRRFDLVYYDGIKPEESNRFIKLPSDEYSNGFKKILDAETRSSFISGYLFDIKPVYDENPFFHYYLKLENLDRIYRLMGNKWLYFLEEGYLLPLIFMIVLILCFILILIPAFLQGIRRTSGEGIMQEQQKRLPRSFTISALFYFAMLGTGFMLVEVSFIQKCILLLENPSYSVALLLTTILVSSGIGSMTSSRFPGLSAPRSLLVLSFLIFAYSVIFPYFMDFLVPFDLHTRMPAVSAFFFPLGFFMGIPFPSGIRLLGLRNGALIPWAWAINACMSVLAPVLTIMLAVVTGFKVVLWTGTLVYLLAFLSVKKMS